MPNFPTIAPAEIAAVAGAVLIAYVAPFVGTTVENYRRRKLERQYALRPEPFPPDETPSYDAPYAPPLNAPEVTPATESQSQSQTAFTGQAVTAMPAAAVAPEPAPTPFQDDVSKPPTEASTAPAEPVADRYSGYEPVGVTSYRGENGHKFRLEDLHRARLAEWPPATIRDDPDRHQLWAEAELLLEQHRSALVSSVLSSPFPVRSACLGGIERVGAVSFLHFLLFPDLWPVSPDQAVARAVFAIGSAGHEIHGRVDVLTSSAA